MNPKAGLRAERAAQVAELRAQGKLFREIAEELGLSQSYAAGLFSDPTGSIDRARKDSYSGTCQECGRATTGSDGPALAPKLCNHCAPWENFGKWARETIIAAIQRFVAENGRVPSSEEWIKSNPEKGYPPRTAVYYSGTSGRKKNGHLFDSWADAIEAAGFPRPYVGIKYNGNHLEVERVEHSGNRKYLVFKIEDQEVDRDVGWESSAIGGYELHAYVEASNGAEAITKATKGRAGKWAVIPESSLTPYEFVTEPSLRRVAR